MIDLLLLKHIYALSDEGVCEHWVHDPHFQYFTEEEFFQHEFPHERSDLSHRRKQLGDRLELLLAESLRVAHAKGALRANYLNGTAGDAANAILTAIGHNLRLVLAWLGILFVPASGSGAKILPFLFADTSTSPDSVALNGGAIDSGVSIGYYLVNSTTVYALFDDSNGNHQDNDYDDMIVKITIASTPLPGALPLFASGLGAMGMFLRRKKQKAALAA